MQYIIARNVADRHITAQKYHYYLWFIGGIKYAYNLIMPPHLIMIKKLIETNGETTNHINI